MIKYIYYRLCNIMKKGNGRMLVQGKPAISLA